MTETFKAFDKFSYIGESELAAAKFAKVLRENRIVRHLALPEGIDLKKYYRYISERSGSFVKRDENYLNGNQGADQEEWMDIRFDPDRQKESFRYSATRQPIHTDSAYLSYEFDISFFFCILPAQFGGATTFIDGPLLIDLLRRFEPGLLTELEQQVVIFDKGEQQIKTQFVVRYDRFGPLLNWNSFRISDKNSNEVQSMCIRFAAFCEKKIFETGLLSAIQLKASEAVFFHDSRVLHGRNAFIGDRCLIKGGISL